MERSEQIEQTAADWLARRDCGTWSDADEAALSGWLESATAHRVAYLRLSAAWQQADRLKAIGAGVPAGTVPVPGALELRPQFEEAVPAESVAAVTEPAHASSYSDRRLRYSLAAAALIAGIAAGWHFWSIEQDTYRTRVGAIATVPIPDGSTVTLNTDSAIRVAVTESERRVDLEHGEAYFEVAHDPGRPFVVQAGSQRVVVTGTKFSVRRLDGELRILVREGRVRVEVTDAAPEVPVPELVAGTVARTVGGGTLIQQESLEEIEVALSWRSGYVVFRDTTLAEAIAEFNRYNTRKIVIDDPALAALRIGGNFRSTNVEAFVRLLEQGFRIRATREGDEIVLTSG